MVITTIQVLYVVLAFITQQSFDEKQSVNHSALKIDQDSSSKGVK